MVKYKPRPTYKIMSFPTILPQFVSEMLKIMISPDSFDSTGVFSISKDAIFAVRSQERTQLLQANEMCCYKCGGRGFRSSLHGGVTELRGVVRLSKRRRVFVPRGRVRCPARASSALREL